MVPNTWHIGDNPMLGYKWTIIGKHGLVSIPEEELFNRIEFQHLTEREYKVSYAMDLGWRYNVDNQEWYRIRGY